MTTDPKEYTIETIKHKSGKRITEVLNRYWKLTQKKSEDIVETAKKIFKA